MSPWLRVACALVLCSACVPRQMGINRMASALTSAGAVYERDDDPEFVRLAAPSTLKTVEMLLAQSPDQQQLLLTACSGFTEYAYAFLQVEAQLNAGNRAAASDLNARAGLMYARARGYCLHGLQLRHAGVTAKTLLSGTRVLADMRIDDVPWLYWTAVSWGGEVSVAPLPLLRLPDVAVIRALLQRARALDEAWNYGAIPEATIALDGLPGLLGGSQRAARADFDRAEQLAGGHSVFAYVALAAATGNTPERRRLLDAALKVDVNALPERRLTNLIAQRSARAMLRDSRPATPAGR